MTRGILITLLLLSSRSLTGQVAAPTWRIGSDGAVQPSSNRRLTVGSPTATAPTVPAYTPVVGNLVLNPSFETTGSPTFGNWRQTGSGTFTDDTTWAHSGTHAVKLTGTLAYANPKTYTDDITVLASTTYYFSFWTRGDGKNAGQYMIRDVTHGAAIQDYITTGISTPAFTQVTGSFTTPAGCTTIYLMLTLTSSTSTPATVTPYPATAWFDDVVISASAITPDPTSPVASALANVYPIGFQQGTTPVQTFHGGISLGGMAAPAPPTVAVGSAGSLTGTYHYVVTYITLNGETGFSAASSAVAPSSQKVNLTNIPVSANPTVIGRNLFREFAGVAGTYYYLTTLSDNTTTTYTDNTTDGGLGYDNHYLSSSTDSAGGIYAAGALVFKSLGVGLSIGHTAGAVLNNWDNVVLVGPFAGRLLKSGQFDTINGSQAGSSLTNSRDNTLNGAKAGFNLGIAGSVGTAYANVCEGSNACFYAKGAYNNVNVGVQAGDTNTAANANTEGHNDVFLGYRTGPGSTTQRNYEAVIGSEATGDCNNCVVLGRAADVVQMPVTTFSALPTCAAGTEGSMKSISDSSTATWGATITGSSTNHVLAYCNGTNWTVAAK